MTQIEPTMDATAKYEIPAYLLWSIAGYPTVVLHRGVWVDTKWGVGSRDSSDRLVPDGIGPASESPCAFCDGCRRIRCSVCDGDGFADCPDCLVEGGANSHTACPRCHGDWDKFDDCEWSCSTCRGEQAVNCPSPRCKEGRVTCPQWRARWCHDPA